jgi:hypothetical protein
MREKNEIDIDAHIPLSTPQLISKYKTMTDSKKLMFKKQAEIAVSFLDLYINVISKKVKSLVLL